MPINGTKMLEEMLAMSASDLLLSVGSSPVVRIKTHLKPLNDISPLKTTDIEAFLQQVLDKEQLDLFDVNKDLDFSIALEAKARFRANAFYQRGFPSLSLRAIPMQIPSVQSLGLPKAVEKLSTLTQGLVLMVGPAGSGKSTTIAALLQRINETRAEHIITIEDPIEFVFANKLSLIEQREMYVDTHSWDVALKSCLRQDPNIVMVGEMRDAETISSAIQIAETGHLVLATLHTNSAAQTVDRIVGSYPKEQQEQIKLQLAMTLEAVISQRLLPSTTGGIIPAVEVMLPSDAIRNLIREGKSHLIDNTIMTSTQLGMTTMDKSLADLVSSGQVDLAEALKVSTNRDQLTRYLKG